MRYTKLSALLACAALGAAAASSSFTPREVGFPLRSRRPPAQPPQKSSMTAEQIAWNAAVDAKKAAKRARRA